MAKTRHCLAPTHCRTLTLGNRPETPRSCGHTTGDGGDKDCESFQRWLLSRLVEFGDPLFSDQLQLNFDYWLVGSSFVFCMQLL